MSRSAAQFQADADAALAALAGAGLRLASRDADGEDAPEAFAATPGVVAELLGDGAGHAVALSWCRNVGRVAWIGRRAWPSGEALRRADLLDESLLVDAPTAQDRLWAAELCARAAGDVVGAVVADGSGFDLTATRRLQLAVRGRDVRLILLRPGDDARHASAAGERWAVSPVPVLTHDAHEAGPRRPAWDVRLLRRKGRDRPAATPELPVGLHLSSDAPVVRSDETYLLRWSVRWDADAAACRPAADVARVDAATPAAAPPAFGRNVRLPLGLPAELADGSTRPTNLQAVG